MGIINKLFTGFGLSYTDPSFLLIDATAVTLGQGHREVIQYIYLHLYILCPKY